MDAFIARVEAKRTALEAEDEHLENMERGLRQKREGIAAEISKLNTALEVYKSFTALGSATAPATLASAARPSLRFPPPGETNGSQNVLSPVNLVLPHRNAPLVDHIRAVLEAFGGRAEAGLIRDQLMQSGRKLEGRRKAVAYPMVRSTMVRHPETFEQLPEGDWQLVKPKSAPDAPANGHTEIDPDDIPL